MTTTALIQGSLFQEKLDKPALER